MAYANLISQLCTDNAEVFKRVRDFLCKRNGSYDYSTTGIGWTLHDAVYATDQNTVAFGDYFVAYSPGEDGDQDIYLKVTYASGYVNVHCYLYWNATTHTGVTAAGTGNNWTNTNSSVATIWVYGDLDGVFFVSKYSTSYYAVIAGHCPDSRFATTVATSAAAVSAGSSVVVTVDAVPSGWITGRKIYIRDNANIEIVTISGISGNDVTLTTVVASYSAGCKLQGEVSYFAQTSTSFSVNCIIGHAGTKPQPHSKEAFSVAPTTYADSLNGGAYPYNEIFVTAANSLIGPCKNVFIVNGSGLSYESSMNGYRVFNVYSLYIIVKEV